MCQKQDQAMTLECVDGKTVHVISELRENRLHILGISECQWPGTSDAKTLEWRENLLLLQR